MQRWRKSVRRDTACSILLVQCLVYWCFLCSSGAAYHHCGDQGYTDLPSLLFLRECKLFNLISYQALAKFYWQFVGSHLIGTMRSVALSVVIVLWVWLWWLRLIEGLYHLCYASKKPYLSRFLIVVNLWWGEGYVWQQLAVAVLFYISLYRYGYCIWTGTGNVTAVFVQTIILRTLPESASCCHWMG